MAYPKNLLTEGEVVVHDLRPHWRGLVVPGLLFLTIIFAGFYLLALFENSQGRLIIGVGMVLLILWFSVRPFLQWMTTNYVFTDRRIIVRSGLIVRRGRDMPLSRINDVSFVHRPMERFLNSGTLYIESAGTKGELIIKDVPDVEQIQGEISRLRELDDERRRSQFAGPGHTVANPVNTGDDDSTESGPNSAR
jgi:uncharacterized membrane protein YdbT with pleckstrin-like domain